MSYIAERMYDVYLDKQHIFTGTKLKTVYQYNPHKAFVSFTGKKYLQTGDAAQFENLFPKYLFHKDYTSLKTLINDVESDLNNIGDEAKSYKTYCRKFLDFLKNVIAPKNANESGVLKKMTNQYQIDGVSELIDLLGGTNAFIKKAIENSYFFAPYIVAARAQDIERQYKANKPIPARWQGTRGSGTRTQEGYEYCEIDTNGNYKVRQVIEYITGYTVSRGQTSIFTNYKISHIWGKAQNPRYFTNLWNLVLVPAWANDLLDKATATNGSIASKMLNTYKAICLKYYNINSLNLINIGITDSQLAINTKDVVKDIYTFKSIAGKKNGDPYGKITAVSCNV